MLKHTVIFVLAATILMGAFGCAQQTTYDRTSQLDSNWGRSLETARYNQILNPDAEKNLEPVEGIPGPAAERVMNGYLSGEQGSSSCSGSGISVK